MIGFAAVVASLSTSPSPSGSSDTTSSPGAATSTHGPPRLNCDGAPPGPTEPTVNTYSSYQAGLTNMLTSTQFG